MTNLLATVLAQSVQSGSSLSAEQIQVLQDTMAQLKIVNNEKGQQAPPAAEEAEQAPAPVDVNPPAPAPPAAPPMPKGASAAPLSGLQPPPPKASAPPAGSTAAVAVQEPANSSSHPKEYRAFQRFCENSKGADEMRKVWVQGGPRRMAVFSQFVATGCHWAGSANPLADHTFSAALNPKAHTLVHRPLLIRIALITSLNQGML